MKTPIPQGAIQSRILLVRGQRVLLDPDLAALYGVATKALVQAVKRNLDRFPGDFMFQLTEQEVRALRSQFVTSNKGRGGRRTAPYVFTEQGVAMLSSVLRSKRAVQVNVEIMRAFVRLWVEAVVASRERIRAPVLQAVRRRVCAHCLTVFGFCVTTISYNVTT